MKILVIDPDWRFAQQAQSHFESHAHVVSHQADSAVASAQLTRWQPDVVLLAAELADDALIETIYSVSPRPAVVLTDHMDRFDRAWRAWQKCGDELLMKPLMKADELQSAMVAAMENTAAGTIVRRARIAASA